MKSRFTSVAETEYADAAAYYEAEACLDENFIATVLNMVTTSKIIQDLVVSLVYEFDQFRFRDFRSRSFTRLLIMRSLSLLSHTKAVNPDTGVTEYLWSRS